MPQAETAKPTDEQIQQQLALLEEQRTAMTPAFQDARGKVGALIFQYEIVPASDKSTKESRKKDLDEAKAETRDVQWPVGEGKTEVREIQLRRDQ